ncbi:hypothetical protein CB0940_12268, partial [Cercospora beticola]
MPTTIVPASPTSAQLLMVSPQVSISSLLGSVAAPPPTPSPALPWPALTSPVSQLTSSALRAHAHLLLLPLASNLLLPLVLSSTLVPVARTPLCTTVLDS